MPNFADLGPHVDEVADAAAIALELPDDSEGMELRLFRFGTCNGLYRENETTFDVVFVQNSERGNGDFRWFVLYCIRRAGDRQVRFMEMMNERLSGHLCRRWGFVRRGEHCVRHSP